MADQETTPHARGEQASGSDLRAAGASSSESSAPTVPPVVPAASEAPTRWGRVDDAGTVYVRTPDGERQVGSWQAGEPAEGLAHFARRFDDIRTEVDLLRTRLTSGAGDPRQALTSAQHIRDGLAEASVVGDVAALTDLVHYVIAVAERAVDSARAARDAARAESAARKQALVEEAEELSVSSTQWKVAGDRLRAILEEWKTIRGVDRKVDEQLWRRFSKARDAFNRRRGAHFADLDRQRATAKTRKQELVEEAEALSGSDDWAATASRYKELMAEWKAAGRAPKETDDQLWQAFRSAQDAFFARRSAAFTERDAEFVDNARRKEELLAEAEQIDPAAGLEAARAALYRLQERWDQIGKVPKDRVRELEGRLRGVEEKVRGAVDAQWRRSDPEAEARVAQFRERVAQFEAQAAKARNAGDNRRADQAQAQATQWREWLAAAEQSVASR
ncbi:MAG: DUF349 domain-containing protein [Kutzneria sp.]|nr:DUF349 domain-containing protein [Kutzneria sp.]